MLSPNLALFARQLLLTDQHIWKKMKLPVTEQKITANKCRKYLQQERLRSRLAQKSKATRDDACMQLRGIFLTFTHTCHFKGPRINLVPRRR